MNVGRLLGELHRRYRATGAELPGGDLVGARGVSMDGWFWRATDATTGRVVLVLAGICTPRRGAPWGILGMAADPAGGLHVAQLDRVRAAERGMDLAMEGDGGSIRATRDRLEVRIDDSSLELDLTRQVDWRGALGGSSIFQTVPGMNQYWHPWLLGGSATGTLVLPGRQPWRLDDAQLYAEKNWGRGGFPVAWWWGQSQAFAERDACLAFAGGTIHLGRPGRRARLQGEVTALVLRTPDGEQLRLGNPGTSPVRAGVSPLLELAGHTEGSWRLDGRGRDARGRRVHVEVRAHVPLQQAFVLPVPLVEQRALAAGAVEAQLGTLEVSLHRDGRLAWRGASSMAALELGGRPLAEQELARRGTPQPRR